jgi:hypothetical protein
MLSVVTWGQNNSTYYGEVMFGKVAKHRDGLLYKVPPVSMIFQAGKVTQTDGSKPWHDYWGFPRLEQSVHFNVFGETDVLGYAIGAAPGVGFYMFRGDRSSLLLHLATGLAYLTREFNPLTNPSNNAIGSNFNNTTQIKLSYETPIIKTLSLDIGFGLTHYSNGLNSSPNSGINVIGFHFGIKPTIANRKVPKGSIAQPLTISKNWGINGYVSYGLSEHRITGGPKYPIKNYTLGIFYQSHSFIKWHAGLDYDYALVFYEFAIRDFQSEEDANGKATSTAAYAAIEGVFGNLSVRCQVGYYLEIFYDRQESLPYSKFNFIYNIPYEIYEVRPFVGLLLKTHVAVADYVALQVGIEW